MSSSSQAAETWISSFCGLLGHEYFAEVSEDFIEDDFNLTGLQSQVAMYKEALEMILDVEPDDEDDADEEEEEEEEEEEDDGALGDEKQAVAGGSAAGATASYRRANDRRHLRMSSDLSLIESSAELLYGLIHQRYITSRPGIQQMAEKYDLQHFGVCPRVFCDGAKVLPVGRSDTPGEDTVKLFCPSCLDIYIPPNSRFQSVDGSFFGTTFPPLFFMTFPDLDVGGAVHRPRLASSAANSTLPGADAASIASAPNGSVQSPPGSTNAPTTTNHATPGASSRRPSHQQQQQPLQPQPQHHSRQLQQQQQQPVIINGIAAHNLAPGLGAENIYEPCIYGFRVSERSRSGPRMQWLRMRPADVAVLDERTAFFQADVDCDDEEDEDDSDIEVEDVVLDEDEDTTEQNIDTTQHDKPVAEVNNGNRKTEQWHENRNHEVSRRTGKEKSATKRRRGASVDGVWDPMEAGNTREAG